MDGSIVVLAAHQGGRVSPVTYELLALAEEIRGMIPLAVKAVILGDEVEGPAREVARAPGVEVVAVKNPNLNSYQAEIYKEVLAGLLPELGPVFVIAAHTTEGMDLSPGLAVRLGAGCISNVDRVFKDGDRICFSRAMFNGKIAAAVCPAARTTILTVQPGAFKALVPEGPDPGGIDVRVSSAAPVRSRSLGIRSVRQESSALAQADVIVAAGLGIGHEENLELITRLAALFPRSAVAGSRPVCDKGWLDYKTQVGLTGATVTPKLYIACGISGALQHTVGMQGSGFIVAVSTDPHAAIFSISDVCIVEDLTAFIPAFVAEYEKSLT